MLLNERNVMAKVVKTKIQKKFKKDEVFPFEKQNYIIIGVGILFIIAGYIALMEKTVEGFLPLYAAPILLVLGYCVIIPIGIMFTRKPEEPPSERTSPPK